MIQVGVLLTAFVLQAIWRQLGWPHRPLLALYGQIFRFWPKPCQLPLALLLLWLLWWGLLAWGLLPVWRWGFELVLLLLVLGPSGRMPLLMRGELRVAVMLQKASSKARLVDYWLWFMVLPLLAYSLLGVWALLLVGLLQQTQLAGAQTWRRALLWLLAWPGYGLQRLCLLSSGSQPSAMPLMPPKQPIVSWYVRAISQTQPSALSLAAAMQQWRLWLWLVCLCYLSLRWWWL